MKKITNEEIAKLFQIPSFARTSKNPEFVQELLNIQKGEKLFLSREEWLTKSYKEKNFKNWFYIRKHQNRKNHRGILANSDLLITTYKEGWVIQKP